MRKRSTHMRTCRRRLPSWPSIPAASCCAAAAFAAAVDAARLGAARFFGAALGAAAAAALAGRGAPSSSPSSCSLPAAALDAFFLAGFFACAPPPAASFGIFCTAGTYAVVCTATGQQQCVAHRTQHHTSAEACLNMAYIIAGRKRYLGSTHGGCSFCQVDLKITWGVAAHPAADFQELDLVAAQHRCGPLLPAVPLLVEEPGVREHAGVGTRIHRRPQHSLRNKKPRRSHHAKADCRGSGS